MIHAPTRIMTGIALSTSMALHFIDIDKDISTLVRVCIYEPILVQGFQVLVKIEKKLMIVV